MDFTAILNFTKKAAKNLAVGVAGAIQSSDSTKLVPAIAPLPIDDVDMSYGRPNHIEQDPNETDKKYEEVVVEAIKEVAQQRSLPYQKKPEVALAKGGLVKRETIAKVGEKEPEVVTPVKNYAESVELVYKQGAALLISSSLGFLKTLPPSKGKSSITTEANRLAAIFGIVNSPKPQKTIGLSSKLEWWGSSSRGGMTASGKDGGSRSGKPSKQEEDEIRKGLPIGLLKNIGLVAGAATLFGAGYYIPKMFPSTVKNKTDNVVDDFKENKLLEKTTDEEGNPKELSEYESILAEREAIEETIAELEKELEEKQKNRSGFTNFLKGTVMGETSETKKQIEKLQEKLNKKREDGKLYYYAIKSPEEQAESDKFDDLLYGKEAREREKKVKEREAAAWKDPDPFKHDKYYRPIVLNPPTANAWEKAVNAAKKDGINLPRHVTSSYRNDEEQAALVMAAKDGKKYVVNPAKPGQSAHGQGWAIDIMSPSPANDWMRMNAKQFGFEWQGEKDPVHFDFITNEENTKYLQHGNDSWIPKKDKSKTIGYRDRYDPTPGEISTKAALKSWRESKPNIDPCDCPTPVSTVNEEPVNQGLVNGTGNVVTIPQIITVPQSQIVPVFIAQNTENEEDSKAIIDPFSKAVVYEGDVA